MAPPLVTIVISCTFDPNEPMLPVVPLIVAVQELKLTVPKSASGRIPPLDDGASAIHSAEVRCAPDTFADLLNEAPVDVSVMVTVNDLPLNFASADIVSPGFTVSPLMRKLGCGKNSYQA